MKRLSGIVILFIILGCFIFTSCKKNEAEEPKLKVYYYDTVGMLMAEKDIYVESGKTTEEVLKANFVNVQTNNGILVMFEEHNTLATDGYKLVVKYNDVIYSKITDFVPDNNGVLIIQATATK